jgi:hypothetical protein
MEDFGFPILMLLFVLFGIAMWIANMSLDKERITDYVRTRGGRIVSINWAPFGRGWFGEKNDRIYEVVYYDKDGNQHFATCKTSLFSGVYWTEDRLSHRRESWYAELPARNAPGDPVIRHIPSTMDLAPDVLENESIDEEIARLEERLVALKRKKVDR